jgi:predicted nucleic acid-binding protein
MTMNELIWVLKWTGHNAAFIREKVEFMFTTPLRFLPATKVVFAKFVELMEEFNLDYGDAQIAAQAVVNAMDRIASFDTDFDRVTEIKRIEALS